MAKRRKTQYTAAPVAEIVVGADFWAQAITGMVKVEVVEVVGGQVVVKDLFRGNVLRVSQSALMVEVR